ncbi:hypothetical protein AB0F91_32300 [Amycolatopsis sp. NPDC023774]|uniref:hypothetical protein n=1 Tax=Amycolatopsis sp. NPDC023774 TaxID=3155015 RepID=UPI0033C17492
MSLPAGIQTALISAGTAAAVALLIEYLAKPSLEARKDRILEQGRVRRDVRARILSLGMRVSGLAPRMAGDRSPDIERVENLAAETQRLADDALKLEQLWGRDRWVVVVSPLWDAKAQMDELLELLHYETEVNDENVDDFVSRMNGYVDQATTDIARAREFLVLPKWRFLTWRRAIAIETPPSSYPNLEQMSPPRD